MAAPETPLHPEVELLDRGAILAIQRDKLVRLGKRLSGSLEWSAHFRAAGLSPRDLADPQGIANAPMLTVAQLHERYPLPMLTAQEFQVERFFATPQAAGPPILFGFTARDFYRTLPGQVARLLHCAGLRHGDRAYQSHDYGLCLDGWAYEAGFRALGATCFPVGPGRGELVVQWLRDQGWDFAVATPAWLLELARLAAEQDIDPRRDWRLRAAALAGPVTRADRGALDAGLPAGFAGHAVYGRTEAGGPVLAVACAHSRDRGELHLINEDTIVTEILDPDTLQPVGTGQTGEVVVTTLDKEASPVVRYRTGERARLSDRPYDCPCGRIGMPLIGLTGR
jgi:phenylacetate-CoA ligase